MKKIAKILLLSILTIGMTTGCSLDDFINNNSSSNQNSSENANDSSSEGGSADSSANSAADSSNNGYGDSSANGNSSNNAPGSSSNAPSSSNNANNSTNNNPSSGNPAPSSSSTGNSSSSTPAAPTLRGIALNTTNVKKEYVQGEALDLTGLVVTASYSDGSSQAVTAYTTSPANGTVLNTVGPNTVTVSFEGQSETFNVNVSAPAKTDWTTAEKALMSDNLYGEVLPYTGFAESEVTYDSETRTLYIEGGAATNDDIADYKRLLQGNSFEFVASTGNYEKKITTTDGDRYVDVYLGLNQGEFYLEAYDPYCYEFPTDFLEEYAYTYFSSLEAFPAIEADYYEASDYYGAVFCYMDPVQGKDEAGYTDILRANNWRILDEKDSDDYYQAVSPDERYIAAYLYNDYDGCLDIYFAPLNYWNANLIEEFFEFYEGTPFTVPALNIDGAGYQFQDPEDNLDYWYYNMPEFIVAYMNVFGVSGDDLDDYFDVLEDEDWEVTGEDAFYTAKKEIEDKGIARFEMDYYPTEGYLFFTIYFKLDPISNDEFPSEKVAKYFGPVVTDTLPEYTGENTGFTYCSDYYGDFVMVNVEEGTETNAIAAYIDILIENDYELYTDGLRYISKNNQILVLVDRDVNTPGTFSIYLYKVSLLFNTWPGEQIAKSLAKGVKDTVPAYTEGYDYYYYYGSEEYVQVYFYTADVDAAFDDYCEEIEKTCTQTGTSYGYPVYTSANEQLLISPWIDESDDSIVVDIDVLSTGSDSAWPQDDIDDLFEAAGITEELPAFEGDYTAEAGTFYNKICIDVVLINGDEDAAWDAFDDYYGLLDDLFYVYVEGNPWYGDVTFTSPQGQFTIELVVDTDEGSYGFDLYITPSEGSQGGDGFPMDSILQVFPQANGVLPTMNLENVEYTDLYVNEAYGVVEFYIEFASAEAASEACTNYIAALKIALFEETEFYDGLLVGYVSPDETFVVMVDTYENEMSFSVQDASYYLD